MTDVQKVSPNLREMIDGARALVETSGEIDAVISSMSKLTREQRDALEQLGIKIRSQLGRIITANIPVGSLAPVTELEFVDYIEGSTPTWLEK